MQVSTSSPEPVRSLNALPKRVQISSPATRSNTVAAQRHPPTATPPRTHIHAGRPRNFLDVLVSRWPAAVPVDQIAAETGYSATSGGFRNALSRPALMEEGHPVVR